MRGDSVNQGLFYEVGTRFSSENAAFQNSLLRSEKTFSFNQGVFFESGTRFLSENAALQDSLIRPKTFFVWSCL